MDLQLQGARVLVTAASSGLGAATATRFSAEGAQVVINSRSLKRLQETAAEINQRTGNPVYTYAADVTDPVAVNKLLDNAVMSLGGLDILVTNAGGPPAGSFDDFDAETWEQSAHLTLLSATHLVRAALPHLRQSSRAAVLAIVSSTAKEPKHNLTLSNVLRPAVVGLMKTLSRELGPQGIRCNSILPGITQTGRVDELMRAGAARNDISEEAQRERAAADIPLGRFGTPEEFANVAVFLCSPAAGFVNGVALPVNGGAVHATL